MENSKLHLIAHRMNVGSLDREEYNHVDNSIEALESVIETMKSSSFLTGFECDVRRTKNNELVVVHDASLKSMTAEKRKDNIADITYDDLKEHRLMNAQFYYKGLKQRALLLPDAKRIRNIISQRLQKTAIAPLASDMFDYLVEKNFEGEVVMELKGLDHQTAEAAVKLIDAYKNKLKIAVKSFSASKVRSIGDKTGVKTGLLDGPFFINRRQALDDSFVKNIHFNFYSVLWSKINDKLLQSLIENEKDLYLWTVESAVHLNEVFKRLVKIKSSIGSIPKNISIVTNLPIIL